MHRMRFRIKQTYHRKLLMLNNIIWRFFLNMLKLFLLLLNLLRSKPFHLYHLRQFKPPSKTRRLLSLLRHLFWWWIKSYLSKYNSLFYLFIYLYTFLNNAIIQIVVINAHNAQKLLITILYKYVLNVKYKQTDLLQFHVIVTHNTMKKAIQKNVYVK